MEADNHEGDSSYGDSINTETTSIKSDILKYRIENGRMYHAFKEGAYYWPNDDQALEQMDIEHHNQGLMLGALHLSPLKDPGQILDLGTGTGIWAMDMGDMYPSAIVTGIDITPTQPSWVPPNVRFEVDDFTQEWTFGQNRFDFVHCRLVFGSIGDIPAFLKQAFHALKPGGWLEQNEVETAIYTDDGTFPMDGYYATWAETLSEAFQKINRPWPKGPELKKLFEEAGFVNVQFRQFKRPSNDWPKDPHQKEIGKYTYYNFMTGLEGFTIAPFTRILGWKEEEVQVLIAGVKKEFRNRSYHGYQKTWVVWGMKPHGPSESDT